MVARGTTVLYTYELRLHRMVRCNRPALRDLHSLHIQRQHPTHSDEPNQKETHLGVQRLHDLTHLLESFDRRAVGLLQTRELC